MAANCYIQKFLMLMLLLTYIGSKSFAQQYSIQYNFSGKDTAAGEEMSFLMKDFNSKTAALGYINKLKESLSTMGYASASIDSVQFDSARAIVWIYPGVKYKWRINLDSIPREVMSSLSLRGRRFSGSNMQYEKINELENNILNYYENSGFPFARVYAESSVVGDSIYSVLKVDPRVLYHIDSIRIIGKAKLKASFLQHYLNIFNGDVYNRGKLSKISRLIDNLPYVEQIQPWDLMMLGTGATINLYLAPRRSSEVNALVGFLPANSVKGKTKVTADVRLNLKNALSGGETILLNWQQIEAQSPRLDLGFTQPYLLGTPYGIDFAFGMLKQDSSYLQLNTRLGINYTWSANKTLSVFYQLKNNYLLQGGVDTMSIRFSKRLPTNMDVSSASGGLSYRFENLNYLFNPRKGFDISISATAGIRKVTPNGDILKLKDPNEPDFDFKSLYDTIKLKTYIISSQLAAAHYSTIGKNSVLKFGIQGGLMASPQIFQNELFRIGGYKLLRGFDEQSIYVDRYSVFTGEYRLLTGINSFLFGFTDLGFTHSRVSSNQFNNSYLSAGLGLELETGFGLLNLSYAIGKRNDIKFDIRNASKIHFGYINYF